MKSIRLLNGRLVMKDDAIILNEDNKANYAGIIIEKNGSLSHYYVFVWKHPISEMIEEEINSVFDMCTKICPEINEIREKMITPIFDEQMNIINQDIWLSAPELLIFPIREIHSLDEAQYGFGIMRDQ